MSRGAVLESCAGHPLLLNQPVDHVQSILGFNSDVLHRSSSQQETEKKAEPLLRSAAVDQFQNNDDEASSSGVA